LQFFGLVESSMNKIVCGHGLLQKSRIKRGSPCKIGYEWQTD
jgi:hypothetical protein